MNGQTETSAVKKEKKPTNVIVEFKVMPEGIEIDLGKIEGVLKGLGAQAINQRNVAFGLKAIHAIFAIPDSEGGAMDRVEKEILAIPGVAGAEVVNMGREVDTTEEFH